MWPYERPVCPPTYPCGREEFTRVLAFLVSFVILAYGWMGHHRLLANLKQLDGTFMAWNFG